MKKVKEVFNLLFGLLISISLFIGSMFVLGISLIWGPIEILIYAFYGKKISYAINFIADIWKSLAIGVDKLFNVLLSVPSNRILITKDGHKFGNINETYSEALGRNILKKTTKGKGICTICKILSYADPDHCVKTAKNVDEQIKEKYKLIVH